MDPIVSVSEAAFALSVSEAIPALSAPEADAGTTCMHVVAMLSYVRELPENVSKTNVDPSPRD